MTDHAQIHEVHERRHTTGRRVISPAQMVAGIIGLSLVAIAFGAIVAIEPSAFDSLGAGSELGLLYLVLDVGGLVAALAFPTTVVDRVATQQDGAASIG